MFQRDSLQVADLKKGKLRHEANEQDADLYDTNTAMLEECKVTNTDCKRLD